MIRRWMYVALAAGLVLAAQPHGTAWAEPARSDDATSQPAGAAPDAAAPSPNEGAGPAGTLGRSVFGNGGVYMSGTSYQIVGTLGQALVMGPSTSGPDPITHRVCSGWWCVELSGLVAGPEPVTPKVIAFGRPRPNPSNGNMTLDFALPREALVEVQLMDVMGRRVVALARERFEAGEHAVSWDGRNGSGGVVGAGVYFMRVDVDGREVAKRRVVVVR